MSKQSKSAGMPRRVFMGRTAAAFLALPLVSCGGGGGGNGDGGSDPAGSWQVDGELLASRSDPVAVVLRDGRVLVMGGQGSTNVQPEIFDPATGKSLPAGTWSQARQLCTATLLSDGRVLVVGGFDTSMSYPAGTLLFDPATLSWTPGASLASGRVNHTATLLPDGRVLVVGGDAGLWNFVDNEVYDPATDTWSAAPAMQKRRAQHTATLLRDGRVLVVGGRDTGDGSATSQLRGTNRVELFDAAMDTWSLGTPLPGIVRFAHTATLLKDGQVLIAGGTPEDDTPYTYIDQAYTYAPAAGTWTEAGRMETPRFSHHAALLADGRVLVGGGSTYEYAPVRPEYFDPATRTWESTPPMVHPRRGYTVVAVTDGSGLAFGGGWGNESFESVEVYR